MSAVAALAKAARRADVEGGRVMWPSLAWRGRHKEFLRDVLGMRFFAAHQHEIVDAYYSAERVEIVVCTGQKLGKTEAQLVCALFDFATVRDLNGIVVAPKIDWTAQVWWPRFVTLALGAFLPCAACLSAHEAWIALVNKNPLDETPRPVRCVNCSPLIPSKAVDPKHPELGRVSEWLDNADPENGLVAPDGRRIRAYTSRKLGGKGGISGAVRFYLDESSDIEDETRAAVAGNMTGGGKMIALGNMLWLHGWFYRAFRPENRGKHTLEYQKSSRFSPNIPIGKIEWPDGKITEKTKSEPPIRGMADLEGVTKNIASWLGTSLVAARIDATAPDLVEGQIIPSSTVAAAEKRWTPDDDESGVLQVGVDVARMRDPIAIAARRGKKIFHLHSEVLGESDHARGVELVTGMLLALRRPHERSSRLVFDQSGPEGEAFRKELDLWRVAHPEHADKLTFHGVQMGGKPNQTRIYKQRRDEIVFGFAQWLKTGAVPPSAILEAEIDATTSKRAKVKFYNTEWEVHEVISNDDMRQALGRSPNERDACMLAVIDLDGSEQNNQPSAPAPALHSQPANDAAAPPIEHAPSMHHRHDALYAALWGRQ